MERFSLNSDLFNNTTPVMENKSTPITIHGGFSVV